MPFNLFRSNSLVPKLKGNTAPHIHGEIDKLTPKQIAALYDETVAKTRTFIDNNERIARAHTVSTIFADLKSEQSSLSLSERLKKFFTALLSKFSGRDAALFDKTQAKQEHRPSVRKKARTEREKARSARAVDALNTNNGESSDEEELLDLADAAAKKDRENIAAALRAEAKRMIQKYKITEVALNSRSRARNRLPPEEKIAIERIVEINKIAEKIHPSQLGSEVCALAREVFTPLTYGKIREELESLDKMHSTGQWFTKQQGQPGLFYNITIPRVNWPISITTVTGKANIQAIINLVNLNVVLPEKASTPGMNHS